MFNPNPNPPPAEYARLRSLRRVKVEGKASKPLQLKGLKSPSAREGEGGFEAFMGPKALKNRSQPTCDRSETWKGLDSS